MILSSRNSITVDKVQNITHQVAKRENKLQVQGLMVKLTSGDKYGFVYCRSTPNNLEIKAICKNFSECNLLMGDFNLSHRSLEDQEKIKKLCQGQKISALNEITRSMSNTQLEYILIDENMKGKYFVTSYNNFISDHKTIVARVGSRENKLTDEIKERLMFDQESHLKARKVHEDQNSPNVNPTGNKSNMFMNTENTFTRKFANPDMATCWLNSCLQLILTAMDYDAYVTTRTFNSELGQELLKLQMNSKNKSLDPSIIKEIIVCSEDTRIATRLSEISYEIIDQNRLAEQSMQIKNLRLDLRNGQQCVRDFFLCLNENLVSWPDVYSTFAFKLTHSTQCMSCKKRNEFETTQLYLEIPVPPNDSNLKDYVEDFLNVGSKLGCYCDEGCKAFSEKMKWTSIVNADEAKFLIVILTRGIETLDGFHLVKNKIKSTEDLIIW